MNDRVDVVVIGGGPAGLQAALLLARACLAVRVLDEGRDEVAARRNASALVTHGAIGFDGVPPSELRAKARADLYHHGVTVEPRRATGITHEGEGLVVSLEDGATLRARRVLLATGLCDVLPALPGLAETWGATVFSCPYCHGFELASREGRPRRWGVLAREVAALKMAPLYTRWSRDLTVFTDGLEAPAELRAAHEAGGLRYEARHIRALAHDAENLRAVVLADGTEVPLDVLVLRPPRELGPLVASLGLAHDHHGLLAVDARGQTSMKGVHACGDLTTTPHQIVFAMADGAHAAMAITSAIAFEDVLHKP